MEALVARAALVGLLALGSCTQSISGPTTEHHLQTSRSFALQVPAAAAVSTSASSVRVTLPHGRWGTDFIELADAAAATDGKTHRTLRNGATVRFDTARANEGRSASASLTGSLTLDGNVWTVACAQYGEDEDVSERDADWCLPYLGLVDPKP